MPSAESAIRDRLLEKGNELFSAPPARIDFSGDAQADELTNDIGQVPHAFVLACVMDRQNNRLCSGQLSGQGFLACSRTI